ncbi:MAG: hypothetical protein HC819_23900 [Cyclobacteriaceae bacterium]|nr:hypothetical protein [Cyclobacteriaceae bacterium]
MINIAKLVDGHGSNFRASGGETLESAKTILSATSFGSKGWRLNKTSTPDQVQRGFNAILDIINFSVNEESKKQSKVKAK